MIKNVECVYLGTYSIRFRGAEGENTIFSMTLSEGFMDEYVDFVLPEVHDVLTEEEFAKVAIDTDLGN